ncbi:MAG: glucose-1-phosphate thymidylyltransferase RfbA [Alcanivorax jadensis]|uniref:glucose-1-phosphate thymidylyltransferase RfbA n=1 Tax=Alcanivorax jadensis TaxID=64988 RepID=UPI0030028B5A
MTRNDTRKGILLAGGTGSRLHPMTLGVSKHLLPVYDKPMIYYPLSVLMLAGIREVLVVTAPCDVGNYQRLLGDGSHLGLKIDYLEQPTPGGIAEALSIAAPWVGKAPVCLVLGDNIFFGQGFSPMLNSLSDRESGATLFAYPVKDPQRFGVVTFDESGNTLNIEEKPSQPISNHAITGLYFLDNKALNIAAALKASARGEKEIVDVLNVYLTQGQLHTEVLGRGFVWLDAGTPETLMEAGSLVQTIQQRQGLKIACLEEIAWQAGWINSNQLMERIRKLGATDYADYLTDLLEQSERND